MTYLLWQDTETTGLHPGPGQALLEVALVVTDLDFQVLGHTTQLVPCDTRAAYEAADPFVKNMHTENGLWKEHADFMQLFSGDLGPATEALSDYLVTWASQFGIFPNDKSTLFCGQGNGAVDHAFLSAYLPRVRALWGHRTFDVSAWRELVMKWYGCKYADMPSLQGTTHRALDDCLHTIEVAEWIKLNFWRGNTEWSA